MTEEEAKKKLCPCFVVFACSLQMVKIANMMPHEHVPKMGTGGCIAFDCMMWRWDIRSKPASDADIGHCGLGGQP